jgi:hypothetical protein
MFSIAVSILRFGLVLFLSLAEPYGPITRQVFANPRFVGVELGESLSIVSSQIWGLYKGERGGSEKERYRAQWGEGLVEGKRLCDIWGLSAVVWGLKMERK